MPIPAPTNTMMAIIMAEEREHQQYHDDSVKRQKSEDFPPSLFRSLTEQERRLWMHKTASEFCAHGFAPIDQVRLLGVAEFHFENSDATRILENVRTNFCPEQIPCVWTHKLSKPRVPTLAQAQKLRLAEDVHFGGSTGDDDSAREIQTAWAKVQTKGFAQIFWDQHGDCLASRISDANFHPVHSIVSALKQKGDDSSSNNRNPAALTFLEALLRVMNPRDLYGVPLLVGFPKLLRAGENAVQMRVGVYAHRLVFEVLTGPDVAIVINALQDSVHIVEPLERLQSGSQAFVSSPSPRVVYTREELQEEHENETREQSTIYAYSNSGFLRLIENTGVDTSIWVKLEPRAKLEHQLMLHQVHGLCWMYNMEHLGRGLNGIFWEKRKFPDGGSFYYSPSLGQLRLHLGDPHLPEPKVNGGILADEMGLGKTIQVLALIVATLEELKREAKGKTDHKHATLVIVPPALVSQWLIEIQKATGDRLIYHFFDHDKLEFVNKTNHDGPPDIVLTTYVALEKYGKRNRSRSAQVLKSTSWGRIVLDEMQEVRSSTSSIAKNCESLKSDRRWMLSGTPLFQGVDDFRGELCFLKLEPFAGNCEDGFFDYAIKSHWDAESILGIERLKLLSQVMLRRAKSMTLFGTNTPLLGLKPLKIVFEPVPQDPSERAIYCFVEALVHKRSALNELSHGSDLKKIENMEQVLLRILRELCLSGTLLNGGMGVPSQLKVLNQLLVETERATGTNVRKDCDEPMSCEEAIRYLSIVEDVARVGDDFVTDLHFGGGGGISRRARAIDSPELLLRECREKLATITNELRQVKRELVKSVREKIMLRY